MKAVVNLILTITLCLIFVTVKAQTPEPAFTSSHLQSAEKLLVATGINSQFGTIADNIISAVGQQFPENQRAAFAQAMKKFMNKYYTWDLVKTDFSKIYAAEFSEEELKQLTDFYNTPTGKKYGEKIPILTQKGMLLGQQIVTQHQTELQQMMQKAFPAK